MLGLKMKLIAAAVVVAVIGILAWQVKYWHDAYVTATSPFVAEQQPHVVTTAPFDTSRDSSDKHRAHFRIVRGDTAT